MHHIDVCLGELHCRFEHNVNWMQFISNIMSQNNDVAFFFIDDDVQVNLC